MFGHFLVAIFTNSIKLSFLLWIFEENNFSAMSFFKVFFVFLFILSFYKHSPEYHSKCIISCISIISESFHTPRAWLQEKCLSLAWKEKEKVWFLFYWSKLHHKKPGMYISTTLIEISLKIVSFHWLFQAVLRSLLGTELFLKNTYRIFCRYIHPWW